MKDMGPSAENIHDELKKMHNKMIELFQVDFTYFEDLIILCRSDFRELLLERIWLKLKGRGDSYTELQLAQMRKYLSEGTDKDLFSSMAFYDKKGDILYISQKLIQGHPEKVLPVCVHELAEKMVSTLIDPEIINGASDNIFEEQLYSTELHNYSPEKFLNRYKEAAFKSIFKEGCCEAISLKTLRHSGMKDRALSIEMELKKGYGEWVGILQAIENMKVDNENHRKYLSQTIDRSGRIEYEKKLLTDIVKTSQVIKCFSYHLGYPIAKGIVDQYGIEGIKAAFKDPPLKAKYFLDPSTYISSLDIKNREVKK
jgi:hypothetical protein